MLSVLISSSHGEKYVFGVPHRYLNNLNAISMCVLAEQSTTLTIDGPVNAARKQIELQQGSTKISLLEWSVPYPGDNRKYNGSFVVTSNREIQIYVFLENAFHSEAFLVLPMTEKSTDYLVTAYYDLNSIEIFSHHTTTKVSITNLNSSESIYFDNKYHKGTINTTLDSLNAMTLSFTYPTKAVRITSDKPVAVLIYNYYPLINTAKYANHYSMIMEQFSPLAFWKNKYIFGGLDSSTGYTIRIISSSDKNSIRVGTQEFKLNEGEIYEKHFDNDSATIVESSQTVLVIQYTETYSKTTETRGFPFYSMTVIPAIEQYLSNYTFTVPSYFAINQVTVYIESRKVSGLRLDNGPLSGAVERLTPLSDKKQYSVLRFQISSGVHRLTHEQKQPFGAILYGFHVYNYNYYTDGACYGLPLGLALGPSCIHSCQNGGECVSDNVCHCKPGFYGQQCEQGSPVDENLKPKLQTLIPGYSLTDPMSWYEQPDFANNNKVCFVKIHVQNASANTIVEGTSSTDDGLFYGNYTAGLIDSSASYQEVSRFACLEVRCPFATINGTVKNTVVRVSIDGGNQTCRARQYVVGISNMTVTPDPTRGDRLQFTLGAGNNYGPHYGVYTGIGTLGKAKYLAEHKCYSGREYDLNSFNPQIGTLVEYICE